MAGHGAALSRGVVACGLALALAACRPAPSPPSVEVQPGGLLLRAPQGIERVALIDPEGLPVLTRRSPEPVLELSVPWTWDRGGTWTVEVEGGSVSTRIPVPVDLAAPIQVEVEAPLGQDPRPVQQGDRLEVGLLDGRPVELALRLASVRGGPVRVRLGAREEVLELAPGAPGLLRHRLEQPVQVEVEEHGRTLRFELVPRVIEREELRRTLSLQEVVLPAERDGSAELGRPSGRIGLPAAWWWEATQALGLGARLRDPWAAWGRVGVRLQNRGAEAVNVVVRLRVLEADGQPAPAFAPRLREGSDGSGEVRVLLRIPAGQDATAVLPLYVDEELLTAAVAQSRHWLRVVEVVPLGSALVLLEDRAPLYVSRGSTAASLGLLGALVAAGGGAALLATRAARWLREIPTSGLMTIAFFSALSFVVGAVGQLLSMGLAAFIGPFATFFTSLVDDCLRYALLATLLTLMPRPGTAALAALTGWLLSGFAMGSFGPVDLLLLGGRVFWLELLLWLAGITRGGAWRDEPGLRRWLRLSASLGGASLATSATGLVIQVVLYRMFYADWYVLGILALPGFLYVALAAALAVPFADSLRRIQR